LANAGRAIPAAQIKGMDENQLKATFGVPALDRKDGPMRALRYQSDGCSLCQSQSRRRRRMKGVSCSM
jgi:hypothetical protein